MERIKAAKRASTEAPGREKKIAAGRASFEMMERQKIAASITIKQIELNLICLVVMDAAIVSLSTIS